MTVGSAIELTMMPAGVISTSDSGCACAETRVTPGVPPRSAIRLPTAKSATNVGVEAEGDAEVEGGGEAVADEDGGSVAVDDDEGCAPALSVGDCVPEVEAVVDAEPVGVDVTEEEGVPVEVGVAVEEGATEVVAGGVAVDESEGGIALELNGANADERKYWLVGALAIIVKEAMEGTMR